MRSWAIGKLCFYASLSSTCHILLSSLSFIPITVSQPHLRKRVPDPQSFAGHLQSSLSQGRWNSTHVLWSLFYQLWKSFKNVFPPKEILTRAAIWMTSEDITLNEISHSDTVWFHLHEVARVVQFIESKSTTVVAKGWGKRGMGVFIMGTNFSLGTWESSANR